MKLFVTGGTGFIGSHFIKLALARGHEVRALRRPASQPRIGLPHLPQWVQGDLESVPPGALPGCDALVHFAAVGVLPGTADWQECFRWNVNASLRLWLQAAAAGIRNLIICGSCFEYGRTAENYQLIPADAPLAPIGPYAASKAAATMAALGLEPGHGVAVRVLRPFHVFGEGEDAARFWPSLRRAALEGADFPMTEGAQVRDFIPVESVAEAFLHAATCPAQAKALRTVENVGTSEPQTLRHFAESCWQAWQAKGNLRPGALPYRADEVMRYVPDISRVWHAR